MQKAVSRDPSSKVFDRLSVVRGPLTACAFLNENSSLCLEK
jgi:hypothetical protein